MTDSTAHAMGRIKGILSRPIPPNPKIAAAPVSVAGAGAPTSSGAGHPSSGSSQASPAAKKSFLGRFAEGYAKKDPVEQVAIGATVVGAAAGVEAATGILSKTADVMVTVATSPGRPAALEHPTRPVTPPADGAGASNISSSPLNSP